MNGIAQELPQTASACDEPATAAQTARDAAFSALVDRHARFLFRVAFSLLKHHQDAEDAVQETLMKLYRLDAWHALDDERAFLACAVWRSGLDRLASASARAMKHAQDVSALDLASPAPSPEDHALGSSDRAHMRALIDRLPDTLRQPLVLASIEGMRSHEVALVLGIPDGTVRTRILRAKAELRQSFLASSSAAKEAR